MDTIGAIQKRKNLFKQRLIDEPHQFTPRADAFFLAIFLRKSSQKKHPAQMIRAG
jgi:hypothetical protein